MMQLRHRPITPHDFPDCLDLMYDRFAFDLARQRQLANLWEEALADGQGVAALVENTQPTARARRVVGFGLNVFVTDAFVSEARAATLPYLATHVLDRWLAGRSPILSRDGVRRANAGAGLNIVNLNVGHVRPPEVSVEAFHDVIRAMLASGVATHRGYRAKEVLAEAYGPADCTMLVAGGFCLRTDFRERSAPWQGQPPTAEQWPYLLGLTQAECTAQPFSTLSSWFDYTPPRFGLRPAEQALLRHALTGATDEELAVALSRSVWTIKKRWQVIYGKADGAWSESASEAAPAVPDTIQSAGMSSGQSSGRGLERRRHLLNYLRDHPEELRP